MSTIASFNRQTEWARYYRLSTEGQITLELYEIDRENRRRRDAAYPLYRHIPLITIPLTDGILFIKQVSTTSNVESGEIRYKGNLRSPADGLPRNIEGVIQFLSDHINIVIRN